MPGSLLPAYLKNIEFGGRFSGNKIPILGSQATTIPIPGTQSLRYHYIETHLQSPCGSKGRFCSVRASDLVSSLKDRGSVEVSRL